MEKEFSKLLNKGLGSGLVASLGTQKPTTSTTIGGDISNLDKTHSPNGSAQAKAITDEPQIGKLDGAGSGSAISGKTCWKRRSRKRFPKFKTH